MNLLGDDVFVGARGVVRLGGDDERGGADAGMRLHMSVSVAAGKHLHKRSLRRVGIDNVAAGKKRDQLKHGMLVHGSRMRKQETEKREGV